MRKIYFLILLGGIVCMSASADGQRFKASRAKKALAKTVVSKSAPVWRPLSQTDYMDEGDGWVLMGEVTFRYDKSGNVIEEVVSEEDAQTKTSTTYDQYNKPVSIVVSESEDGEEWINSSKRMYVYDSKVHDFFIERLNYSWTVDQWTNDATFWETNVISRNNGGSITSIVKSVPLSGVLVPIYKSEWKYGADGRANQYSYYSNYNGADIDWQLDRGISYADIQWAKTDGQMTVFGNLLELTQGDNLIKSAVVYVDEMADGHYLVEYTDDFSGCTIKETTNDINEVGCMTKREVLDDNGSMQETYIEYFDGDGNIGIEPVYKLVQKVMMDRCGNVAEVTVFETIDGSEEQIDGMKVDYVYDNLDRVKESVTSIFDYDSQEYFQSERTVYGDYVDVTSGIGTTVAGGDVVWSFDGGVLSAQASSLEGLDIYSLQGVLLREVSADGAFAEFDTASLSAGMYLVKARGTSSAYRLIKR